MKVYNWIKHQIQHKMHHLSLTHLKTVLKKHGWALLIIIVGWEIVEDLIFPTIFWFMGKHIDPTFFALIPASLIICFHWMTVPLLWGLWIKISGSKETLHEHVCSHGAQAEGCDHE